MFRKHLLGLMLLGAGSLAAQDWFTADKALTLQFNQMTSLNRSIAQNYKLKPLLSLAGLPLTLGAAITKFPAEDQISEVQYTYSSWAMKLDQPVSFVENAVFLRLKRAYPLERFRLLPYVGIGLGLNLVNFQYTFAAQVDTALAPVDYRSTSSYLAIGGQTMTGLIWLPTDHWGLTLEVCYQLDYFDNKNNGNLGFQGWFQVVPALVMTF